MESKISSADTEVVIPREHRKALGAHLPELSPESLANEDLGALEELKRTVAEALSKAEALALRLKDVEAAGSLLSDRVRCVVEDSLRPALRDLLSIEKDAHGEETA